ncbi:hypothetical protein KM043_010206 [Ampulex compressa]|nr:hypothetical protein KM043_010206 [Ampulex compressa]
MGIFTEQIRVSFTGSLALPSSTIQRGKKTPCVAQGEKTNGAFFKTVSASEKVSWKRPVRGLETWTILMISTTYGRIQAAQAWSSASAKNQGSNFDTDSIRAAAPNFPGPRITRALPPPWAQSAGSPASKLISGVRTVSGTKIRDHWQDLFLATMASSRGAPIGKARGDGGRAH